MIALLISTAAAAPHLFATAPLQTRQVWLSMPDPDLGGAALSTAPLINLTGVARVMWTFHTTSMTWMTLEGGLEGTLLAWSDERLPLQVGSFTVPVEVGFLSRLGVQQTFPPPAEDDLSDVWMYIKGAAGPSVTHIRPTWWERYLGIGAGAHLGLGVSFPTERRRWFIEGRGYGQLYTQRVNGSVLINDGTAFLGIYPGRAGAGLFAGVAL